MAWIRLDDQIAHHPKFLRCTPTACWLYVTCIGHAQNYATNGFLAVSDLSSISHVRRPRQYAAELVAARLWDPVDGGWQIHDYLDYNDDAETVKKRKAADRDRKRGKHFPAGIRPESGRIPEDASRARASVPVPIPLNTKNKLITEAGVGTKGECTNGNGSDDTPPNPKAKPVYQSDRFVVFQFHINDLMRLLGPHFDAFDVFAFFDTLAQQSRESGLVIPQRDSGAWLQAQVLTEARRRKLKIAAPPRLTGDEARRQARNLELGGQTCPHTPMCDRRKDCVERTINEGRAERGVAPLPKTESHPKFQ